MDEKNNLALSKKLSEVVIYGMQEKKASDIVLLDLRGIKNSVADFFVVCSGNSDTQLDAIADSVDKEVFNSTSQSPWHFEGKENKEWILMDYVDVVAHIFKKDKRAFYALESLWGDAKITEISDLKSF